MEAEGAEPITLIDEAGVERRYRLHDAFDLEGVNYYLVEAFDDPSQVLLLRESTDGLETVDGEEFKRVITALEKDDVE
jgi:diaminopimelate decarboxylase